VIDGRDKTYEMFGDLAVMEMTVNHVAEALRRSGSPQITRWLLDERVTEPRLMVIYVRPGSYATEVLPEGAAVETLNGKKVRTLDEWRAALVPEEDQVWNLETDMGVVVAMPFKETLTDQIKRSVNQPYLLTNGAKEAALKVGLIKEVQDEDDEDDASTDSKAEKSDNAKSQEEKKSNKGDEDGDDKTAKQEKKSNKGDEDGDDKTAKQDDGQDIKEGSDDDFVTDDDGEKSFFERWFGWASKKLKLQKTTHGGASLLQSSEKVGTKKSHAVGEVAAGPLAVMEVRPGGGLVAKPSTLLHDDFARLIAGNL